MADETKRDAGGAPILNTMDDIRDFARNIDTRIAALEARKPSGGGAGGKRLDRIEGIMRTFFRDEFTAAGDGDAPDTGDDSTAGAGA